MDDIEFNTISFPLIQTGTIDNAAGQVNEVGASAAAFNSEPADRVSPLFTLTLTALATGTTLITTDSGEAALSEIAVFGEDGDQSDFTVFGELEINTNGGNRSPVTGNDDFIGDQTSTLSDKVLANDSDPDNDGLQVARLVRNPVNGSINLNPSGAFDYVPNSGFRGLDTFIYEVTDSNGATDIGTVSIFVSASSDRILGTPGADTLNSTAINNEVLGLTGNDTLSGGDGNDFLDGGEDDDSLFGKPGNDTLRGGDGNDIMGGGQGNDILEGGNGDDGLYGKVDSDTLRGGNGDDTLGGGKGGDRLEGGDGNDLLLGKADNDVLLGGPGNDILEGRDGDDRLNGNRDKDQLFGGNGDDTLSGGKDDDLLLGSQGLDQLSGGSGNDTLGGGRGPDILNGGDGDDILTGGRKGDTLTGGSGDDTFRYIVFERSLLTEGNGNTFDIITDLTIGFDLIDGLNTVSAANVLQAGEATTLDEAGIQSALSSNDLTANGAATLTFDSRDFLILNDSVAGYQQSSDALIEITGYTGDLASLAIA